MAVASIRVGLAVVPTIHNSFFGNAETDKLIDEIRSTLDEEKRNALYRKMQEIIAEEQPYIFLFAPQYRIAISKKINNAQISTSTSSISLG